MNRRVKSSHKDYKKKQGRELYKQFDDIKKQEKEQKKRSLMETISSGFNLPDDVIAGAPLLMATGKNQICVENYKGIIEYTGTLIRIQTKICKIVIEGKRLNIDYFTSDEMRISGYIDSIRYI